MVMEMEEAMRALGKSSLNELSPDDLVALDSVTAEITGVRQAFSPAGVGKNTCRESLEQLNHLLHYARQLTLFLEAAARLSDSNDSSAVQDLQKQYQSLIQQKR
jgi:hypothetical protein